MRSRLIALLLVGIGLLCLPSVAPAARPATDRPFLDKGIPDPGEAAAPAAERAGRALRRTLGRQGVVDVDARSDTPRVVARLDGFLTAASGADPEAIVLDYLRGHPATFGLDSDDLARLKLVRRYTTTGGVVHLAWAQTYGGIPALGSQLIANVTRDGRIVNVLGGPKPDIGVSSTTPGLDAGEALAAARRDARAPLVAPRARGGTGPQRTTRFAGGDEARLVVFVESDAERLAWNVLLTAGSGHMLQTTVDASTGRVLRRVDLTKDAVDASVFDHYPGAASGGAQHTVDIEPYLNGGATTLTGDNAHAYADLNDNNVATAGEETNPSSTYTYTPFTPVTNGNCPPAPYFCSWNLNTGSSWSTNRNQVATQVFWYVNHFHDHLAASPISFTADKGSFDPSGALPNDPLNAEVDDGANGAGGRPDGDHIDNANMSTPPDGASPRMQMYLFGGGGFGSVNGGDDATIVYHEYTHGLSSRLVTDSGGAQALNTAQAGAMGEAWSDWYAVDFLAAEGFVTDTATEGDVKVGEYVDRGQNLIRYQGLDCPVGSVAPACPGTATAGPGGFTFGDFGKIYGAAEVHADGEIWGETLWQLRQATSSATAELLITRALELSPPEPSFLDMRNAILQADTTYNGGAARTTIWSVLANRGMGYFASTLDSADVAPVEDFSAPPAPGGATGTLTGTVTSVTGPVSGAKVRFGGHDSGFTGDLVATTAANGTYSIPNVPVGTYPQLLAGPVGGHDRLVTGPVTVGTGTTTRDLVLVRDWAASAGGASVADFTGTDYTSQGCGPGRAIDQSAAGVWSTTVPTSTTRYVTIALPQAVDVTGLGIDPTAGCGDDSGASLAGYKVEVSSTSAISGFTQIAAGTFTPTDLNRTNAVAPSGGFVGNVHFVRLTALSPQNPNSGSGLSFIDVTEFEVFGAPAGTLVPGATAGDASGIGTTTATLNGAVVPKGLTTSYHFEYGTSTGYGLAAATGNAGAGSSALPIASALANLQPATTYHYRVVATSAAGTAASSDHTFKTAAAPDKRKPKAKLSVRSRQRIGPIVVTVTSDEAGSVLGTATAGSTSLRPRASKVVTLGRGTKRLTKPAKVKVKIKLSKSATRRLRRARKRSIRVTVRITVTDKAGNASKLRKTITIRR